MKLRTLLWQISWTPFVIAFVIQDWYELKIDGFWTTFVCFVCFARAIDGILEFIRSKYEKKLAGLI